MTKEIDEEIENALKRIDASIDKYAITGNHDFAFAEWDNIIENSGFINLNDKYDVIFNKGREPILLAGISTNLFGDPLIDK